MSRQTLWMPLYSQKEGMIGQFHPFDQPIRGVSGYPQRWGHRLDDLMMEAVDREPFRANNASQVG